MPSQEDKLFNWVSQMRIWINDQKKKIYQSTIDLTNQIQLCIFLVGDTSSILFTGEDTMD